jgi:outer membrane protein TolC
MMQIIRQILLTWLLTFGVVSAQTDIHDLVAEALAKNPGLEAVRERVEATRETVSQAGALPDPQLNLGLMNLPVNSFAFDQEPMTSKMIGVMQLFPFPGKLGLKKEIANLQVRQKELQLREAENQLRSAVIRAYFDLYFIDRALETVDKNKELVGQLLEVAQTQYVTGKGLQQDVLRAQVELTRLEDDRLMWQQKRQAMVAQINSLLDRPSTESFAMIPDVYEDLVAADRIEFKEISGNRPLILAWQEMLTSAGKKVDLAKKDVYPNFALGATYNQRNDLQNGATMHDFFSATVSVNIPLYFKSKQKAAVQENEKQELAARAEYRQILNQVQAKEQATWALVQQQKERTRLYREGILIQAEQSFESALSGYQVAKVDFLTLINNWKQLLNFQLETYRAVADYYKALADYERITGFNQINEEL